MLHLSRMRITRPYCTSVALEEEKVWIGFYRRVGNPAIAAEVIQHLDADADQKRIHPALYLGCKEILRRKKARQARTSRNHSQTTSMTPLASSAPMPPRKPPAGIGSVQVGAREHKSHIA